MIENKDIIYGLKYPSHWLRYVSRVKLYVRPSNPQLKMATIRIKYNYFLGEDMYMLHRCISTCTQM